MKVLFTYSPSVRPRGYIFKALKYVPGVDCLPMDRYLDFDDSGYDGLIYSPIAFECQWSELEEKYRKAYFYTPEIDEKYHRFKGKKLLFDTRDEGNSDGFGRFKDCTTPRMKITPGYDFMKRFNVIIPVPFTVRDGFVAREGDVKTIFLLYCSSIGGYPHTIRKVVFERLKPFNPYTKRVPIRDYEVALRSAKIAVSVPGWGTACKSHGETLAARTLLFAHESIKTVKLLPFSDMVDGEHYVSFNLDNLEEKLTDTMKDDERLKRISENGRNLFDKGYCPKKTGEQILEYFREESLCIHQA